MDTGNLLLQGLFVTSIAFKAEGRVLMPSQAATATAINDLILDAALAVAHAVPRPLSMRAFAPYFANGRPSSLNLTSLLW